MADTKATKQNCDFTLYGDVALANPFSGTGSFTNVTGGIPGMDYTEVKWASDASVAAGMICVNENKPAAETKTEEKKTEEAKTEEKKTEEKKVDDKPADKAAAEAAKSSYTTWSLAAVYGKHTLGLYAPAYVDNETVFATDASMALSTEYVGLESMIYPKFARGFAVGLKGFTGLQSTCESTGAFGSVDCDGGSVMTDTASDFYLGKGEESYLQVKDWMLGGAVTLAWDPVDTFADSYSYSGRSVKGGGIKIVTQFGMQGRVGYDPLSNGTSTVTDEGGTHISYVDVGNDQTRAFTRTWTPDGLQTWATVGIRVEGNPLYRIFNKAKPEEGEYFLGYQITPPKEEKETKPSVY